MAKTAKGKQGKKKNLKLRRQLRKTFGCLFMISALIVTAIPVTPTEAVAPTGWDTSKDGYFVSSDGSAIPTIQTTSSFTPPVYQDETGNFFFVFVDSKGDANPSTSQDNKFAIIVDYNRDQTLDKGMLTIPAKVDAYVRFTDSSSVGTYAAANKLGYPLYYKVREKESAPTTRMVEEVVGVDENGKPIYGQTEVEVRGGQARAVGDFVEYAPCLAAQKAEWCPDGVDVDLYYYKDSTTKGIPPAAALKSENYVDTATGGTWQRVVDNTDNRIGGATVQYIGKQYAVYDKGNWSFHDCDANRSVFGGTGEGVSASNIISLNFESAKGANGQNIGSPLTGIGDYAFYNCTNISSISLGNGLATMGNYAFANCRNLTDVKLDYNTRLEIIGAYAFANCLKLQSFPVPTNVRGIGDFCFQNCLELKTVDLSGKLFGAAPGTGLSSSLEKIGYYAFSGCAALEYLDLPRSYNGAEKNDSGPSAPVFHLSTVKGCTSLQYIKTHSADLRFVTDAEAATDKLGQNIQDSTGNGTTYTADFYTGGYAGGGKVDGTYTFDNFKADVGDEFYFEAPAYKNGTNNTVKTPTHNIANVRHICFRYYDGQDRYEIVESAYGIDDKDAVKEIGLVFEIDSPGNLIGYHAENKDTGEVLGVKVPEVNMPTKVGPYKITSLVEGSFTDDCWIEKVTLSDGIKNIGANTFKGCHNLKYIIFDDAAAVETIGKDAFATQVVSELHDDKTAYPHNCTTPKADFLNVNVTPFMSFTGKITNDELKNTVPFTYAMKADSKVNAGEQQLAYITYYSGMPTNLTVKYNPDTLMSELQYFPTKADANKGFAVDKDAVGAYRPFTKDGKGNTAYRFPYITDTVAAEVKAAFSGGTLTENQTNIKNGVENIVVPNGVNSIQTGLFSGLDKDGLLAKDITVTVKDDTGADVTQTVKKGEKPPKDWNNVDAQDIKSLTTQSVAEILPYTFARLDGMEKAYINGATKIGNYAFDDCSELGLADIGSATTTLGLRPFRGCDKLANVSFQEGSPFAYADGVIYGLSEDGTKKEKIVECLESRGTIVTNTSRGVGPDELEGIKEIAEEAFMDCDDVNIVDLSKSAVSSIPDKAFAEMDKLFQVILPDTARIIRNKAFVNTPTLGYVTIPGSVTNIAQGAFAEMGDIDDDESVAAPSATRRFEFVCLPDSVASDYASLYEYIGTTTNADLQIKHSLLLYDALDPDDLKLIEERLVVHGTEFELTEKDAPDHTAEGYRFSEWSPGPKIYSPMTGDMEVKALYVPIGAPVYTVRFFDIEGNEMEEYTQQVEEGKAARGPSRDEMEVEGKVFTGWDRDISKITSNLDVYPLYTDRVDGMFYVTFWTDMDMTQMIGKVQEVASGESAIEPAHPTKEGFTFSKWSTDAWKNVTKDLDVFAVYVEGSGTTPGPDDPNNPDNPDGPNGSISGNGNGNGNGNGGGSGDGDDGNDGDNNNSASGNSVSGNGTKYKVVVNGGSGSGEYTAGTIVPINAYARADGTVFDKWTSSSNGVGFVNQTAISTTFTMPSNNVEINANFKVGSSSSVSGNSRSARRNSTTLVDVSKGGISNTDIASANVNGSSDNFVVKITDDAQATAAVIAALEAKYGDLSNIAYLPMDISLYDATGATKITDVSGITVDITLPLPDELIQYAGNNKAAAVANGRLEDLNTRFTTIDGIPCVQFTATHFSPYTIYVDTANLTAGTIDATPKTGDPIHPKWFLAMGLACISIVLFCKKDKQPKVKHA